jgi:tetrapyrrole methylase family protein/MazG family protein
VTVAAPGRIVVIGLGPAGPELVTAGALAAIEAVPHRFLRTARHPAASVVPDAETFDEVYEAAADMEQVYSVIAARLTEAAAVHGEVLYAVPGSPMVAERTVQLLLAGACQVDVRPAMSFLDLAWARLGVDPLATGVRLVDGHRFASEAADERGPLLVGQCDSRNVLSEIKLAVESDPPQRVTVLRHLGLPDERVWEVPWAELDHEPVGPDHLTSIYIPHLSAPVGAELVAFAELVRTLRAECPWDREQTHETLRRHALEEAYEVVEAIDELEPSAVDGEPAEDAIAHLEEELGDLLFQVYFHATIAAEHGWFTLADVARGINDKLVRRHPHVFADVEADTSEEVLTNWEAIKKAEKGRASVMEGIPASLPALMMAAKVGKKAAAVGFEWPDVHGALEKLDEEVAELRAAAAASAATHSDDAVTDELGDVLFSVVNVARHLGQDPETALREAVGKFRRRFTAVEALAAERGLDLSDLDLAGLDALWDEVKAQHRG